MQSHTARLASFSRPRARWPHPPSYLATPASLAAAGFFFNPAPATPDAVSCFLCDKGLADWDPHDDPASIHAEKCPTCPWALLRCIPDTDDRGTFSFSSSRLPASRAIEKARLATFGPDAKSWWPHKGPSPKTMAKAGFIYTPASPKDDTCICIYCSTELAGWLPDDDPIEEHRKRQVKNGPCPFFTTAKPPPRSKSKAPPTSLNDDDLPVVSTTAKKAKKTPKTKSPPEEIVDEYLVALDDDEDKPRPKPRRVSSRSRASSRSQASDSDASSSAPRKRPSKSAAFSKQNTKPKRALSPSLDIDVSASSKKRTPKTPSSSRSKPGSKSQAKRTLNGDAESDADHLSSSVERSIGGASKSKGKSTKPLREDSNDAEEVVGSKSKTKSRKTRPEQSEDDAPFDAQPAAKSTGKGKKARADSDVDIPVDEDSARKSKAKGQKVRATSKDGPPSENEQLETSDGKGKQSRVEVSPESDGEHKTRTRDDAEAPRRRNKGKTKAVEELSPGPEAVRERTNGVMKDIAIEEHMRIVKDKAKMDRDSAAFPPKPQPQPNGTQHHHHYHEAPPAIAYKSFQSPEDAEFAREEQALEAQARALMLADDALTLDIDRGKSVPLPPPPPSTPPPPLRPAPHSTTFPALPTLLPASPIRSLTLTAEERAMTVEQWVRHEMDTQYERLARDGRHKINAFKTRAEEVKRRISEL